MWLFGKKKPICTAEVDTKDTSVGLEFLPLILVLSFSIKELGLFNRGTLPIFLTNKGHMFFKSWTKTKLTGWDFISIRLSRIRVTGRFWKKKKQLLNITNNNESLTINSFTFYDLIFHKNHEFVFRLDFVFLFRYLISSYFGKLELQVKKKTRKTSNIFPNRASKDAFKSTLNVHNVLAAKQSRWLQRVQFQYEENRRHLPLCTCVCDDYKWLFCLCQFYSKTPCHRHRAHPYSCCLGMRTSSHYVHLI